MELCSTHDFILQAAPDEWMFNLPLNLLMPNPFFLPGREVESEYG